jgi:hypothetical protein
MICKFWVEMFEKSIQPCIVRTLLDALALTAIATRFKRYQMTFITPVPLLPVKGYFRPYKRKSLPAQGLCASLHLLDHLSLRCHGMLGCPISNGVEVAASVKGVEVGPAAVNSFVVLIREDTDVALAHEAHADSLDAVV